MPNYRRTKTASIPRRESKYDDIIDAARRLRRGEWLEIDSDEYSSPAAGRVCVRQALNRSEVLDEIRDRKEFDVRLLDNDKIGITARRPR